MMAFNQMAAEELIRCPVCGYPNDTSNKLCIRCNTLLKGFATDRIEPTPDLDIQFRSGSKQPGKVLYLHVYGGNKSIELDLQEGEVYVIGRRDPSTHYIPAVDLTDYQAADKGVSRRHAELHYEDNLLKLLDLESANFTYLNDQKLIPKQARLLRDGDNIRLGHLLMTLQFGERSD